MVVFEYPDTLILTREVGDEYGDNPLTEDEIYNDSCNCQSASFGDKSMVESADYVVYFESSVVPKRSDKVVITTELIGNTITGVVKQVEKYNGFGITLWIEEYGN